MKPENILWNTEDNMLWVEITPDQGTYVARVRFIWRNTPQAPYVVGLPECGVQVPLNYVYPDGAVLRGSLKLMDIQSGAAGKGLGLWGNFHYGLHAYSHFEGVMCMVGEAPAPCLRPLAPCDPPADEVAADEPVVDMDIAPASGAGRCGDLFPYIYMRTWPECPPTIQARRFITYEMPGAAAAPFSTALAALKAHADLTTRARMTDAAVAFIEGDPPWQGLFLGSFDGEGSRAGHLHAVRDLRNLEAVTEEAVSLCLVGCFGVPVAELSALLDDPDYAAFMQRVWQSYFALVVVMGYRPRLAADLLEVLRLDHLLRRLAADGVSALACINTLLQATVVLPQAVFPLPPAVASPPASPPGDSLPGGWIEPYAVGALHMTRHEPVGYETGEVARILNVLRGECRETRTATRQATRRIERGISEEAERDHNLHDDRRNDLTSEVLKTLMERSRSTQYDNFDTSYGPPATVTYQNGWTVTEGQGARPGSEETTRFARDVLDRTISRITRRTLSTREVRHEDRHEQSEASTLDNRTGTGDLVAVYRYLNRLYRVRVETYGNRLMIAFYINHPGRAFIARQGNLRGAHLQRPMPLAALGVATYADLSPACYPALATRYALRDLIPPPAARRRVGGTVRGSGETTLTLPEGYMAQSAVVTALLAPGAVAYGLLGNQSFQFAQVGTGTESVTLQGEEGNLTLAALVSGTFSPPTTGDTTLTAEVECVPSPETLTAWQVKAYAGLEAAYRAQSEAYFAAFGGVAGMGMSAAAARRIEQDALQKGAYRLLLERAAQLLGRSPEVPPGPAPDQYAVNSPRYLEYFEQAFEWGEAGYAFYGGPGDGDAVGGLLPLGALDGTGDDLFTNFLQADAARLLVPVRPGMGPSVLYYLATGTPWFGPDGDVPTFSDDLHVTNALKDLDELPQTSAVVGAPWEVVVPTDMVVLAETSLAALLGNDVVVEEVDVC